MKSAAIGAVLFGLITLSIHSILHAVHISGLLLHPYQTLEPAILLGTTIDELAAFNVPQALNGKYLFPLNTEFTEIECELSQESSALSKTGRELSQVGVSEKACHEESVVIQNATIKGNLSASEALLRESVFVGGYLELNQLTVPSGDHLCIFASGDVFIDHINLVSPSTVTIVTYNGTVHLNEDTLLSVAYFSPAMIYRSPAWKPYNCFNSQAQIDPII